MKNKPYEMCILFDFYGDMLTEKQREVFDLYYNEDLSLAEISSHTQITRQAVRDSIMRCETILRDIENKLCLAKKHTNLINYIDKMQSIIADNDINTSLKLKDISKILVTLKEQDSGI